MNQPILMNVDADPTAREAQRRQRLECLQAELAKQCPTCRLRLNRNGRTMLSLRGRQGGSVISVHLGLLDHPEALAELPGWISSNGRRSSSRLRQALQEVWREQRRHAMVTAAVELPELEILPIPFDLQAVFALVHHTWFPHLSRPAIRWGRNSPRRRLTSIRFACYRSRPQPAIVVNPRLRQPWVPKVFVEHVLYHELCHHAQASAPIRGEPPHSQRFRRWEAGYQHHELAKAWEQANLSRFLEPD